MPTCSACGSTGRARGNVYHSVLDSPPRTLYNYVEATGLEVLCQTATHEGLCLQHYETVTERSSSSSDICLDNREHPMIQTDK